MTLASRKVGCSGAGLQQATGGFGHLLLLSAHPTGRPKRFRLAPDASAGVIDASDKAPSRLVLGVPT